MLGFFDEDEKNLLILTHGFAKKTQKTPPQEIETVTKRKHEHLSRKKEKVSDVKRYIQKRVKRDKGFVEGFETGYATFKIGVMLRQAREASGMTQEEVAARLRTKKSAISRIENHADDVRLSTIRRYAEAVGANLQIKLAQG